MWVKEEQKYVRKSTRTKNLETGICVGKEFYLDVHSKLSHKEPIFPKKFKDVVEEFLEEQQKMVGVNKTLGRWSCVKGHTKHLLDFIGENTNLLEVQNDKWKDYYSYRKTIHPEVVNDSLLNEKFTIGNFYKFCVYKKYLPHSYVPEFPRIDSESRRREHFTESEWKTIYTFLRTNDWLKHKNPKTEELRKFIRDYALVIINCGTRPLETTKLKWDNVDIEKNPDKEPSKLSVRLKLGKHQTKTKKSRVVIGRRGDVFNRINSYSKFTKPTDFVFCDNDTGKPIQRDRYYNNWKYLIKKIGFDKVRRDNSFYPLRHSYCTWRLQRGVDVFDLSKNMGTSIQMIQKHYEHVIMEMTGESLVKDVDLKETDMLVFD
jgi:integrase